MLEPSIARHGYKVYNDRAEESGHVTSGSFLPTLKKNMGLCIINSELALPETVIHIDVRGKKKKAKIVKKPFYTPVQRRRKNQ